MTGARSVRYESRGSERQRLDVEFGDQFSNSLVRNQLYYFDGDHNGKGDSGRKPSPRVTQRPEKWWRLPLPAISELEDIVTRKLLHSMELAVVRDFIYFCLRMVIHCELHDSPLSTLSLRPGA